MAGILLFQKNVLAFTRNTDRLLSFHFVAHKQKGSLTSQFERFCSHPSPFGGRGLPATILPNFGECPDFPHLKNAITRPRHTIRLPPEIDIVKKSILIPFIKNQIGFRFLSQLFLRYPPQTLEHILTLCRF